MSEKIDTAVEGQLSRDDLAEIISKAGAPPGPPDGPIGALPDGHFLKVQAYKQADAVLAAFNANVGANVGGETFQAGVEACLALIAEVEADARKNGWEDEAEAASDISEAIIGHLIYARRFASTSATQTASQPTMEQAAEAVWDTLMDAISAPEGRS